MRKIQFFFILTPAILILPLSKIQNFEFNESLTSDAALSQNGCKNTTPNPNDDNAFKEYRIKKVVIDAGHGGHDSGALSDYGVEKKNTLAIALKLGAKIKENFPNVEVIYTRQTDVFVELHERAAIANRAKADLFISIHCNSTDEGTSAHGTETYVLGMHRKEENLAVAKRENASILLEDDYQKQYDGFDPNSNEAYIMFSLYQNAYLDKSILFANNVETNFKVNDGRRSLGVKQAGFLVLRETAMPSVLVETGFINNYKDGRYISGSTGQEEIATSIYNAFVKYKKTVESKNESPESDMPLAKETTAQNAVIESATPEKADAEAQPTTLVAHKPVKNAPSRENANRRPAAASNAGLPPKPMVVSQKVETMPANFAADAVEYKIQVASSTNDMSAEKRWKTVQNLEVLREGDRFRYYITGFRTYEEAQSELRNVRNGGFKDAFIVPYKNGKRVSMDAVKK